jgi:hypothetical protein
MTIPSRRAAFSFSFAAVLWLGSLPLVAQEPKASAPGASEKAPVATRVFDPARRVPSFFGQIGLTTEQREAIYTIQGKRQQEINDLQKQIAKIRADMLAECETQLTDTQKQLLESRRRTAAERKKARVQTVSNPVAEKPTGK